MEVYVSIHICINSSNPLSLVPPLVLISSFWVFLRLYTVNQLTFWFSQPYFFVLLNWLLFKFKFYFYHLSFAVFFFLVFFVLCLMTLKITGIDMRLCEGIKIDAFSIWSLEFFFHLIFYYMKVPRLVNSHINISQIKIRCFHNIAWNECAIFLKLSFTITFFQCFFFFYH